jgi:hypothetical protein
MLLQLPAALQARSHMAFLRAQERVGKGTGTSRRTESGGDRCVAGGASVGTRQGRVPSWLDPRGVSIPPPVSGGPHAQAGCADDGAERAVRYTHEVGGSGPAKPAGEVSLDGAWRAVRRAGERASRRVVESTSGWIRSAGIRLAAYIVCGSRN